MYHFLIVEDHPGTAERLKSYILQYGKQYQLDANITIFDNGESLLEESIDLYDLIFLDIELPGIDGMTAACKLRERNLETPIIFVTNLAQYAVNGYEVNALDFIVKPVSYAQFSMKFRKALVILSRNQTATLSITMDRGIKYISSQNLYYIEILNHNLIFHTSEDTPYRCRGTLSEMEQKLEKYHFIRISSCYLINMSFVSEITVHSLLMTNGDELKISRSRKKDVLNALTKYIGGGI